MRKGEAKVAIGPNCENRTLERDRLDAAVRQCLAHRRKLIEERTICPVDLVDDRAQGSEDVVRHSVGRDARQAMRGQTGQPMADRLRTKSGQSMP